MRKDKDYGPVKESRFPSSLFAIYFVSLLWMSGIHSGLVVLVNRMEWNAVVQTLIPSIYWGMALVKRVLELLDGDIQIFSEVGKGSTFLVTLHAAGASENEDGDR